MAIAEAVRFLVRRRRSRNLPLTVAIAAFVGGLILTLWNYGLALLVGGSFNLGFLYALLWPVLYAILSATSAYYRLKGITL